MRVCLCVSVTASVENAITMSFLSQRAPQLQLPASSFEFLLDEYMSIFTYNTIQYTACTLYSGSNLKAGGLRMFPVACGYGLIVAVV